MKKINKLLTNLLHNNKQKTFIEILYISFMNVLIVISLISITIDTIPDIDSATKQILNFIEFITIFFFSLEYILKITYSTNRIKYIFSLWGLIDLLTVIPYYLSSTIDLRALRAFRLFSLLRVFKLVKTSNALSKLIMAMKIALPELILFLSAALIIIYLSAIGIYHFEHKAQPENFASIPHALWWAVITLTTIGYGDVYPITLGGKIFTSIIVLVGLGFIAMPSSIMTSALTQARLHHDNIADNKNNDKL